MPPLFFAYFSLSQHPRTKAKSGYESPKPYLVQDFKSLAQDTPFYSRNLLATSQLRRKFQPFLDVPKSMKNPENTVFSGFLENRKVSAWRTGARDGRP